MTAIREHLSSLLMSEIVWPNRLWHAVGHTIQRLDIRAPQMYVDFVIICGDDAGTCVSAVGLLMMPAVLALWSLAENSLIGDLCWLWRTGPDCYDLNGGIVVVRGHRA